jgi:hypothetical protein
MAQENKPVLSEQKSSVSSDSDLLLRSLVQLADVRSEKMSITLFVQGSIVSGLLIGEKAYFEALNNALNAFNPDGSDKDKEVIRTFLAPFQSLSTNLPDNQQEQSQWRDIEFIHLKDAKFYSGDSLVTQDKGSYWRGRLSRIDGFWLGNLSSNKKFAFGSINI